MLFVFARAAIQQETAGPSHPRGVTTPRREAAATIEKGQLGGWSGDARKKKKPRLEEGAQRAPRSGASQRGCTEARETRRG